jgi:hypothetical protein
MTNQRDRLRAIGVSSARLASIGLGKTAAPTPIDPRNPFAARSAAPATPEQIAAAKVARADARNKYRSEASPFRRALLGRVPGAYDPDDGPEAA